MKAPPRIGDIATIVFTVDAQHAIEFGDEGMPTVLSTPWLIWFLEHAAREALQPLLEPAESTVGLQVDVQHLAPTPLGMQVTCHARVIHVENTLITFQVEAHDEQDCIARGLHKRRVVRIDRFAARVSRKTAK